MIFYLYGYLAAVNLAALAACGYDKAQARRGGRRVPERRLLMLCALGGAPLFWLGMGVFHHKTRHARFALGVPVMALLWAAGVYAASSIML